MMLARFIILHAGVFTNAGDAVQLDGLKLETETSQSMPCRFATWTHLAWWNMFHATYHDESVAVEFVGQSGGFTVPRFLLDEFAALHGEDGLENINALVSTRLNFQIETTQQGWLRFHCERWAILPERVVVVGKSTECRHSIKISSAVKAVQVITKKLETAGGEHQSALPKRWYTILNWILGDGELRNIVGYEQRDLTEKERIPWFCGRRGSPPRLQLRWCIWKRNLSSRWWWWWFRFRWARKWPLEWRHGPGHAWPCQHLQNSNKFKSKTYVDY